MGLTVSDCLKMGGIRATYETLKQAVIGWKVSTTDLMTNTSTQSFYV